MANEYLTSNLPGQRSDGVSDSVVEPSGLSCHHFVDIPLAHEDDKDPDALIKTSVSEFLLSSIFFKSFPRMSVVIKFL